MTTTKLITVAIFCLTVAFWSGWDFWAYLSNNRDGDTFSAILHHLFFTTWYGRAGWFALLAILTWHLW